MEESGPPLLRPRMVRMFTEPDWQTVMSTKFVDGCLHEYEDIERGLQQCLWAPSHGSQKRAFGFRADPLKRRFPDEESMIRAYEQAPGVICLTCGAILDTATPGG